MPDNFLDFVNMLMVGGGLGYVISRVVEFLNVTGDTKHFVAGVVCILAGALSKLIGDLPPEVISSIEPWYDAISFVFVAYFGSQLTYFTIIKDK